MGLGEFFGKINEKMNAGFDSFIAFLDEKGIPAQKYADFLEEKGVPAMWFTILIVALIIALIVLLVTVVFVSSVTLNLSLITDDGITPDSVFLNISKPDGTILLSEQVQNGTQIKIKGIGVGDTLFFNSTLEGYNFTSPLELPVSEKEMQVSLIFEKQEKTGKVTFKVINGEEQTTVGNAKLSFYDDDELLLEGATDEYGGFDAVLPLKKINLTIDRDGYEQYTKSVELIDNKDYIFELSPKEFDPSEEGSFKFVVKDITQNALNNVKIDVYNIKSNSKLGTANTNEDGIAIFSVKKGTSIRFVAQKDGFAVFDSNIEGISRTLLTEEEVISFIMPVGGGKLNVIVTDSLGIGIQEAKVSLYTVMLIEQLTQTTDIGGTTSFSGLDYTILKYVSVYREGYYPQTKLLDNTSEMKFELEKVDLATAAIVDVFVVDKDNKPVGNATLEFKYGANGEFYPITYPNPITSVTGYFTFNLEPDITLHVSANTDDKYGEGSLLLKAGRNRIDVKMENTGSKFTMYLYDKYGKPLANAHVMLFDKQGNLVYDGYTDALGKIDADALGNKELDMFVTDENGNTYSQTINPKDKMQIKLEDNKNKNNLFVSLSKITDLDGKEVSAMQKGKTYLLVFNLFWPEGLYSGGLHIRLGSDSEKYVANQDVGIIGFDGAVDNFKYGISYSPLPLPGDYSVDYYSTGVAGQFNKWLELYFTNPAGNSNLKVRVKSKVTTDLNSMEIRYRAWTQDTNSFTRNPVDSMLGINENITTKYGLYADTYLKEVQLMDGSLNCENDVCVSYTILDDQYTYDVAKFNGVLDYYYALDVELTSVVEQQVSLSVQTEDDPKLYLGNYSENVTEFSPKDEKNTKQNVTVDMSAMEKKKVRFYFNPFKEGLTNIAVKTITSKGVIERNIPVNIYPKKEMEITLNGDFIPLGDDFPIVVKEKEGSYLTNAKITITNKKTNKNAMFIEGTGKTDLGKDGRYLVKNTLPSGFYLVSVTAPGYLPTEVEILVGNVGALYIKGDNELIIPKNSKQGVLKIPVQNKTKMAVESISVNVVNSSLSPNFGVSAKMVTGFIAANGVAELMVTGSYVGDEARENGVVELEIVGVQNKNEITKVKTKVFVYYNKEINNTSCLWASKEALIYSLPAVQNSKVEDSILFRNNCEYDLKVMPQMISDDVSNYGLQLNMQGFDLKKGEEKSVKLTLSNLTPAIMSDETKVLSLYLATDYFTKNIPVNITIWNAASSLSIVTAGHIFVSAFKELQGQYVPVIIQNNGRMPIYNIQVMASNNRYQMQSYDYGFNNGPNFLNSYSQLNNNRYNRYGYNSSWNNHGVDAYTYQPGLTEDYYANPGSYVNPNTSIYNSPAYGSYTFGGNAINFMPSTIQVLAPGQATMLQGYINTPSTSKQTEQYYGIQARGTIQGVNQMISANGYLVVHVSPDKCISVKGVSTQDKKLTYISEILGKDIGRTFTLVNNCAEPVSIVGTSETELFGNKIVLSAPTGTTIEVGQEKEFILTVTASKEISRDNTIFVKGILGVSNAPFNLTLLVNLRFGGGASTGTGAATITDQKQAKDCVTDNETTVFYPRITTADCSTMGYCDSESMSKFLIAKIKYYLELYNKKLTTLNNKLQNTNCAVGSASCSFEDFGLEPLEFDVYFSNDKLTEAQLNNDLKKINTGLIETAITEGIELTEITSTWTKRMYLDKQLDGCGKYGLKITGAVQVINDDIIQKDSYNLYVQVLQKEKTSQCELKVQNALNYLPKDAQTKKDNVFGLRPGYIDSETSDLEPIVQQTSKQIFNQDRFLKSRPNTLFLKKDSVEAGNLVEFSIDQKGTDIITTVKINKNLDLGNEAIQKDVVKAITGFINGNFDGCIVNTGEGVTNSAKIKSGTGGMGGKTTSKTGEKEIYSGDIKLGICSKLPLGKGTWSCEITVESQSLDRIELFLTYPEETGLEAYFDSKGQKTKTINMAKEGNKSVGKSKINVEITDAFKVNSGANSDSSGLFYYAERDGIKTGPIRIAFDAECGITAQTFVNALMVDIGKNEKDFKEYALIYEKGVDSRNTCEVLTNFVKEGSQLGDQSIFNVNFKGTKKYANINYPDCPLQQKSVVAALTDNATDPAILGGATAAGMAACFVTENWILKFLGPIGWAGAALDCGIFMGINVGTEYYKAHRINAEAGLSEKNWTDTVHDGLASVPILGTVLGFEDYSNIQDEIEQMKEDQSIIEAGEEGVWDQKEEQGLAAVLLSLRKAKSTVKPEEAKPPEPEVPPETTEPKPTPQEPIPTEEGGTEKPPEKTPLPEETPPTEKPKVTFDQASLDKANTDLATEKANLETAKKNAEIAKATVESKSIDLQAKNEQLADLEKDYLLKKGDVAKMQAELNDLENSLKSNKDFLKKKNTTYTLQVNMDKTKIALDTQKTKLANILSEEKELLVKIDILESQLDNVVQYAPDEFGSVQSQIGEAKIQLQNTSSLRQTSEGVVKTMQNSYDSAKVNYDLALEDEKKFFESLKNTKGQKIIDDLKIAQKAKEDAFKAIETAEEQVKNAGDSLKAAESAQKTANDAVKVAESKVKVAETKVKNLEMAKNLIEHPGLTNERLNTLTKELDEIDTLAKQGRNYAKGSEQRAAIAAEIDARAQKIHTLYTELEPELKNLSKAGGKKQGKAIIAAYKKLGLEGAGKESGLIFKSSFGEKIIANKNLTSEIGNVKAAVKAKVSPTPMTPAKTAVEKAKTSQTGKTNVSEKVKTTKPPKVKKPSKIKTTIKSGTSKTWNFMKGLGQSIGGGAAGTFAFYSTLDWLLGSSKLQMVTINVDAPKQLYNSTGYTGDVSPYLNDSRTLKIYEGSDGNQIDNCGAYGMQTGFKEATGTLGEGSKEDTNAGKSATNGTGINSEPTDYDAWIIEAANNANKKGGIPLEPEFFKAILKYESGSEFSPSVISSTGCSGLGQICMSSAISEYIKVQCKQNKSDGPKKCDATTCKNVDDYIWCESCADDGPNCVQDDRFDPYKNLMSSAITVKGKIDSVGDCGTDRIMAWAAAYNMGQSWVKKAIAKNGGNCNDWPNETWYKLKEVSDESNGELTAAKIANKKGDFTNTSSDYVAKINNQYLAYKGSGIESGDTKIANNSGENNPIEDCGEIMLVGDSLTEGYSKYFDDSCPGVEVCAESGKSTTWMVENCFTDEKLADKKYVVIMGGVNNINTPDKVKSDLALMYSKANQKGIKVLALTIMPWKGYGGWTEEEQQYTENVNAWIKQANISGAVLDTYGLFNNGSDELNENYATDGKLHLNDQGNTVLASQVSGALISIGATGQTQPA